MISDKSQIKRTIKGRVVSAKMQKTVVVRVDALKKNKKYQRYYKSVKKFKAHDSQGQYREGDIVIIQETRPMSREKRWEVVGLVERPFAPAVEAEGIEEKNED